MNHPDETFLTALCMLLFLLKMPVALKRSRNLARIQPCGVQNWK